MKLIKTIISPLILVGLLQSSLHAQEVKVDNIEAVVNDDVILTSDIKNMRAELTKTYEKSGRPLPDQTEFNKQILDKLISDTLQLQIAERMGFKLSEVRLNQTLQEIAKNNKQTLAQLRADVENSGMSYRAYVDNIRNEITINEVRQENVRRRIQITEHEANELVKRMKQQGQATAELHFAHILLKVSEASSKEEKAAKLTLADELVAKLKAGADINKLAVEYSKGPKAAEGGDWGWRKMDAIPSLFAGHFDASDKKGEIIGPFNTHLGIHIVKILDKKGLETVMAEEVKSRHILIKSNIILSDAKAQSLLKDLRQQILDGKKTFAELAKEYSQDTGSAVKGGELGWADPSMYVPEFRDLAKSLPIGEISQPFQTAHGWHILQVMERRKSDVTDESMKQKAYSIIYRQRFPAEAYAWINELRQEAYIKINNPDYIIEEE